MNKKLCLTFITLILLALIIIGCKLPAAGAPPPITTQAPPAPTATTAVQVEPTNTAVPPTPVVVTETSVPPTPIPPTPLPVTPTALPQAIRIQFAAGGTSAVITGNVEENQTLYYVLKASATQTMTVKVASPNGDVFLGVFGADGVVLLNNTLEITTFTGPLPTTQDYYLSLTPAGAPNSYTLSVQIPPLPAGPTPNVTPAAGIFDPLATYGNPTFDDPMTGINLDDWKNPSTGLLPDTDFIKIEEKDEKFFLTGKLAGFSTWYFTWRELKDFYLQAAFDSGSCSGKDAYGLIIRGPQHLAGVSHGYVIAFSCDGALWVYRLDSASPYTAVDLVSWTPSEFILAGANKENLMGIKAIGTTLTIYANGHQVANITDNKYTSGRYGLFVSPELTAKYTYRVVHMLYWDLSR